jgi:beta-lactam-binding protein with PASTA domain
MNAMSPDPKMPQLWNLKLEEAKAVLDSLGIQYRVSFAQSKAIPEGELLSVSPRPGTTIGTEMEALIMISSGPPLAPGQR